jgi:P27 family predicted phage terminase small subunit
MPGPAPTPTNLKIITGNRGKRGVNKQEPDPEYLTNLAAPAWLYPEAAAVWAEVVPGLAKAKLLTVIDVPLLAMGCVAIAQYRLAAQKTGTELIRAPIEDKDDDSEKPAKAEYINPWMIAQSMSFKQAMAVFQQFGMSPAARTRIAIQPMGDLFNGQDKAAPYFT